MDEELFTIPEACVFMKIARSTLYEIISERKIGTVKIRGAVRIWKADILVYLQAGYKPALKLLNAKAIPRGRIADIAAGTLPGRGPKPTSSRSRMRALSAAGKPAKE